MNLVYLCGPYTARTQKAGEDSRCSEDSANPGDPVTVARIEGCSVDEIKPCQQGSADMPRHLVNNAAVRINRRGHACICGAQDPAIVLDGTHPNHIQVFPRSAGISVPSIVAQVHKNLCPVRYKLTNFISKDRLIANENPVFPAAVVEYNSLHPGYERKPIEKVSGEKEQGFGRNIFAKRYQMDFVVATAIGPIFFEKACRVIETVTSVGIS